MGEPHRGKDGQGDNAVLILTPRVKGARYGVQPGTQNSFGHLTMAHPDLWSDNVLEFMRELGD